MPSLLHNLNFFRKHKLFLTGVTGLYWLWTLTGLGLWTLLPGMQGHAILALPHPLLFGCHLLCGILLLWFQKHPPLRALTALCVGYALLYPFSSVLASNLLFYLSPLCGALALHHLSKKYEAYPLTTPQVPFSFKEQSIWFIGAALLFTVMGVHFTRQVGEHSGDEGHYILQAQSLHQDGDLDIKNNLKQHPAFDQSKSPEYYHIATTSKEHNWYSWHTPGLSILLSPVIDSSLWARHALLGIISSLGLLGTLLLAMQMGATRFYARAGVCMLGGSIFWVVYSCRTLPEITGATLAVWACLFTLTQGRKPWSSGILTALCIVSLPWIQTRFIPLAVMAMGAYGLYGLLNKPERWIPKLFRLALFTLLCLGGFAAFMLFQHSRYQGGSAYPVEDLLFSLPMGLWHTLGSNRGILIYFPLFASAVMAGASCCWMRNKSPGFWIPLLYLCSIFFTSCATKWFTGGSCLPGRFLAVILPVLIALLVANLHKFSSHFKLLTYYTGLWSVAFTLWMWPYLSSFQKSFSTPYRLDLVHPMLNKLITFYYDPYLQATLFPAVLLYLLCLLFILCPKLPSKWAIASSVVVVIGYLFTATNSPENFRHGNQAPSPTQVAALLQKSSYTRSLLWDKRKDPAPSDLFRFSDRFAGRKAYPSRVTLKDLGTRQQNQTLSLPHIDINDWEQRDYRWATLLSPFKVPPGQMAFAIQGQLNGNCRGELVLREGNQTLLSFPITSHAPFHKSALIQTQGDGDIYLLLRLEGEDGNMDIEQIHWSPAPAPLLQKLHLQLPL
ncbi:hypothetical protein P3T73_16445 [Kiritimatiellota bacterium B12222]|nr:hypothetical protein P3T73_16445 [Kiritimatiellota bacterium B12222]